MILLEGDLFEYKKEFDREVVAKSWFLWMVDEEHCIAIIWSRFDSRWVCLKNNVIYMIWCK